MKGTMRIFSLLIALVAVLVLVPGPAAAQQKAAPAGKPNILVIWGDDIGNPT